MDFAALGIRIDSSEVRRGTSDLDNFSRAGGRAETSADELASTMRGLKGLFAGIVTADVGRRLVQTADAFNSMNSRLALVTRSTREFTTAQRALFDISQSTRVGLEQTTDLFGSLSRSTESLGVSQSQVLQVTETINQALIVSGASAQSAQAALVQLGQGFASGALRGEELNSVLEQTPRLARAIADGLGVPLGKLRELGQTGKLTGEQVFQALQKSAKGIQEEFARMPLTVDQATTQAANSWMVLIGAIDEATGATSALSAAISESATFVGELAEEIRRASQGDESVGFLAQAFQYVVETVKILYAEVKFVFEGIGREIGAVAAQIMALSRLDIQGFTAISDAVKEDARRARIELDAYISSVRILGRLDLSPDNQSDAEARRLGLIGPTPIPRKKGPTDPGKPKKDPIAAAQLAADLASYKRQLSEFTAAFEAEEAILEARRSAGLVSESDYYAKRVALVNKQNDALIQALESEKKRIEQEKVSGADAIRNRSRVADLESEISRARKAATVEIEVLGLREQDAANKMAIALRSARDAANEYVDAVARANDREIASMGKGNRQREIDDRRNQRDDQFLSRRQQLGDQLRTNEITPEQYEQYLAIEREAHDRALAEDDRYWTEKLKKQQDWSVGASEAIQNYYDQSQDIASQIDGVFTNAFQGMEDALVSFVTTGKLDFKSLADSIIADITRMIIKQQMMKLLMSFMGGGPVNMGTATGADLSAFFAKGGVVNSPGLSAYSGSIVNRPTLFPFAKGMGLMGEAGPEAILPLKRGSDGKLGVEAGGGGTSMTVHQTFVIGSNVDRASQTQVAASAQRGLRAGGRNL